jgi:glycosyltransferase involved in cell wall biosynthesis
MQGKGQHVLIHAFNTLVSDHPKMYLVLVGKGLFDKEQYEKRLRKMVVDLGIENRVLFTGWVENSAVIFKTFDIAVHSSIGPDSPLSVMEAMASGCPLILTAVPGCQEMVRDGEALLIAPDNPDALRKAIVELYEDAVLREQLSIAGRIAAVQRFNLEGSIRHIENVFLDSIH